MKSHVVGIALIGTAVVIGSILLTSPRPTKVVRAGESVPADLTLEKLRELGY